MSGAESLQVEIGGRIREARESRNVSLRSLARELEISPSALSLIERGQVQTSLQRIFDIARRLDVHPKDLIEGAYDQIPRVAPSRSIRLDMSDQRWTRGIAPGETWAAVDSGALNITTSIATYEPGTANREQPWAHPGDEMLLVLEGRVLAELGEQRFELSRGDSVAYPGLIPHRTSNPFGERASFLTITSGRQAGDDVH